MITSTYTGSITLYSSDSGFPGPKTVPGHFNLRFSDDLKSVEVIDFEPVVIDDIDAPIGKARLTASLSGKSTGTFDPATGALIISAKFRFKLSVPLVPPALLAPSILALKLTTTQATMPAGGIEKGQPVAAGTGSFRLVAAGVFKGGKLDQVTCGVILDGSLTPAPI